MSAGAFLIVDLVFAAVGLLVVGATLYIVWGVVSDLQNQEPAERHQKLLKIAIAIATVAVLVYFYVRIAS